MTDLRHARIETTLGDLTVAASGGAIVGVYFPDHRPAPAAGSLGAAVDVDADALLASARRQILEYLDGGRTTFDVPTATSGSELQERVWAELRAIPFGETRTYGQVALAIGARPELARAVGGAVGRNPLSIIVGCHRVLGAGGRLTGFAGGIERKRRLLDLEAGRPSAWP